MNIAVLFDGAGLARLGLEQAGHVCTGFEIDPDKHRLSAMVGSGNCILADVRDVDLSSFDAVWASPPCQEFSDQNHVGESRKTYGDPHMLEWSLNLPHEILWVENVISDKTNAIMEKYRDRLRIDRWNAAQFLEDPIQKRRRYVVGRFRDPVVYRPFQFSYPKLDISPAVLASEYGHGGFSFDPKRERRKASLWLGRPMTLREMAYLQGLDIPDGILKSWWHVPPNFTHRQWMMNLSQAIGNGVPVYMSQAFGSVYNKGDNHAL